MVQKAIFYVLEKSNFIIIKNKPFLIYWAWESANQVCDRQR